MDKKYNKKVITLILDGWGIGPEDKFNAILNAKTPNFDRLVREYPNVQLKADGEAVGLPKGQMGTSEVNHMTIGAGRVILQDLPKINKAIEDGSFYTNSKLLKAVQHARENKSKLHLIGIFSDGGIHTITDHPLAILELLDRQKFEQPVCLHLFSDGRDTPPKSAEKYLKKLDLAKKKYKNLDIRFSTYQGRFYLDRDRDWSKTEKVTNAMIQGGGKEANDWEAILNFEYNQNNKDEFFPQYVLDKSGLITDNDAIIFYHYRTDRLYQVVYQLIKEDLKNLEITTFIKVSEEFNNVNIAFPRDEITETLAGSISKAGKTQAHITETEKFPHLTFFLNGEKEKEMPGEHWIMLESNRIVKPHYNFEPSMQNHRITEEIIKNINEGKTDFIIANYTTADMVGHTGNYEAAIISAESVDYSLGRIYEAIKDKLDKYALIVTADHGNSDEMWDYKANQPHTQHTLNPVPFILVSGIDCTLDRKESLEDVAPTVLALMGIDKPEIMTGTSLILEK